jgi:hypothetical protein
MAQNTPKVKHDRDEDSRSALVRWIDTHPRTGWYCALLLTLNFMLNLVDALNVDPIWFAR